MKDPSNCVVDKLRLRVCLVPALVRNNPETGGDKTDGESVQRPKREAGKGVQVRTGQGDVVGGDTRVEERGALVDNSQEDEIPDTVKITRQTRRKGLRRTDTLTYRPKTLGQTVGSSEH